MGTGALSSVGGRWAGGGSGEHRGANPDPPPIALFCTEVSLPPGHFFSLVLSQFKNKLLFSSRMWREHAKPCLHGLVFHHFVSQSPWTRHATCSCVTYHALLFLIPIPTFIWLCSWYMCWLVHPHSVHSPPPTCIHVGPLPPVLQHRTRLHPSPDSLLIKTLR